MGGSMGGGGLLDGYTNARDMFDGGGAGQSGSEFEGGGLLSVIANALGKPLKSQSKRPQAAQPMMRPQATAPVMGSSGPVGEPQQTYTYSAPVPVTSEPLPEPMQYGPPARALVGQNLRDAMNPQANKPDDLLRQFEGQLLLTPGGADVAQQMRSDGDLAERLLLEWIRNGYEIPGA